MHSSDVIFTSFQWSWTVLSCQAVCVRASVGSFVRLSRNVRLCTTANKLLDLEAHFFTYICMLTRYVRQPNFFQIVNFLDLHFQGQQFESSTSGSSYVIVSQTVTDRADIAIAIKYIESRVWPFDCRFYI